MLQVDPGARHVDAWVLVHWVLGRVLPAVDQWEKVARGRLCWATECTRSTNSRMVDQADSLAFVMDITTSMTSTMAAWTNSFNGSLASTRALRQSDLVVAAVSQSLKDSGTHPSVNSFDAVTSTISMHTYQWARFLAQSKVAAYYDDTEQVGVRLGVAQAQVECGEEIWSLCGVLEHIDESIVRAPLRQGVRWSYYGFHPTMYLSGPISMINHACRLHFNVSLQKMRAPSWAWRSPTLTGNKPDFIVAVAERRIEAFDRIYAVYDDDEESLTSSRGIGCLICAKVKIVN